MSLAATTTGIETVARLPSVCAFDPFNLGLRRYTFRNHCDERTELALQIFILVFREEEVRIRKRKPALAAIIFAWLVPQLSM